MRRRYDFVDSYDNDLSLEHPKKREMSIYSVSPFYGVGLIFLLLTILGVVILIDDSLPTALKLSDENQHPEKFIAERARHDLKTLTAFGPRVAGSYENEVLAVDFLTREIGFIIHQAHRNHKIESDVQVVNGSFYLRGGSSGRYNSYSNIQNVVVKLHGTDSEHSLLLNAHFDSVPTSPGGSDDGINCAAALEILRKISRSPDRPRHNIIFLFNGAEETGLPASHGFIVHHKWANSTKAVINLEASGHGGKIILFQTGPRTPWIMKYYSKVPHPYGQASGEEIFQSGIIPSDTDFRIFRDFGGLIGVDMAFYVDGYRYHTKYDDFEHLPLGSFQHVGDNTLTLVKEMANAPELGREEKGGNLVFFDFLGLFIIYYPEEVGLAINVLIIIASFAIFGVSFWDFKLGCSWSTFKFLAITTLAILGGWLLSAIAVTLLGNILDRTNFAMTWYGHPWMVLGLFCTPTIGISSAVFLLVNHKVLAVNIRSQIIAHLVRLVWTCLLLVLTVFKIRGGYVVSCQILFTTLAFVVIHAFRVHNSVKAWLLIYLSFLIIPIIFEMYSSIAVLKLFIPISGRAGSDKNFDVLIGILCCVITVLTVSPLTPLIGLMRKAKYFFIVLGAIFLVTFIIVFTPLGFPYNGDANHPTPQRYWTLHSRRVFYGENGEEVKRDSGFFLLNMDRNSPGYVKNYVKEISSAKSIKDDCEKYLLCGFPLAHSKMVQIVKKSTWIPTESIPNLPEPSNLTIISKEFITDNTLSYELEISGPSYLAVFLSPKLENEISLISLDEKMPDPKKTLKWNNRPLYLILHIGGNETHPFRFNFTVLVENYNNNKTVEIGVGRVYSQTGMEKTAEYENFLKQFPKWAAVISQDSTWIPAPQPLIPEPIKLKVLSRETIDEGLQRYTVSISGPDRIMIYLSPKKNHRMYNLTLDEYFPINSTLIWNGRPLFMISHIWGKINGPCVFSFDVEGNSTEVTTEIAFTGIYVHETSSKTASYLNFLKQFPDWADLTAWIAAFESRFV